MTDNERIKTLMELQREITDNYNAIEKHIESHICMPMSEYDEKKAEQKNLGDQLEALWWAIMSIQTYEKMERTGKSWDECYPYRLLDKKKTGEKRK